MNAYNGQGRHRIGTAFIAVAATACAASATAAPTPAATKIENIAVMTVPGLTSTVRTTSNTVTLNVDQVVDVSIAAAVPTMAASNGVTAVGFVVGNPGNGSERYQLAATADVASVTIAGFASDIDGNGAYDPSIDTALDGNAVELAAGARQLVFALVRDAAGRDVTVTATATATVGHGAPGTVYAGAGTDGVDAVVGTTGAEASASTLLTAAAATPTLVKSQSVTAPDGSARVVTGAIVTYQLVARFPAATRAPEVTDAIPDGLSFVPGSITLDGQPMSDASGDDDAEFDGTSVHVALGEIASAGTRTIRFKTKIS